MKIGFHTDAFNSYAFSFMKSVDWAEKNDIHYIECGIMDGVSWIHGLGYFPHVSMIEDPVLLRDQMASKGVAFSQIDSAYPLSDLDGAIYGVPYVLKSIPWAKHAGCPNIATTDGLYKPEKLTDAEAMENMKRSYGQILEVAHAYDLNINIEIHGYFTTKQDKLEKMLEFCDSELFGLNFDTGNSFIAGNDPVEFCKRFLKKIKHVHIKDVSEQLAKQSRGEETGIAISHCAIGDGVNAGNITECLKLLRDSGYNGVLSMETEGQGGPMIEKSLKWLRKTMADLNIAEER